MNLKSGTVENEFGAPSGYWLWGLAVLPLESLATAIARRLDVGYFSLNRQVAQQSGQTVETALSSMGETDFRKAQFEALTEHLQAPLALGQCGGEVDTLAASTPANELVNLGTFGLNNDTEKALLHQVFASHKPQKRIFLDVPDDALAALAGLNRPRSVALGMPRLWLKQQALTLRSAAEELQMQCFTLDPQEEIDEIVTKLTQRL